MTIQSIASSENRVRGIGYLTLALAIVAVKATASSHPSLIVEVDVNSGWMLISQSPTAMCRREGEDDRRAEGREEINK